MTTADAAACPGTAPPDGPAPDLRLEAPDLRLEAPDLRLEAPDLRLEAPDLRLAAPDLRLEAPAAPDLRLEAPDSRLEAPDSRLAAPAAPESRLAARLRLLGRLGWGVADQAVSSLGNFVVGLFVARVLGPTGFGAFTLAFVTYSVALNAARGMATDPLLVRFGGATPAVWRRATGAASATSLTVGLAAGIGCLFAGLVLPASVGPAFVALALGLPGLMVQDSWRFAFFAAGRPAAAFVNDLVWLVLLGGALVVLTGLGNPTVFGCMLAFGVTATLAAVVGALQARTIPSPRGVTGWLRDHRRLSSRYLVENVTGSGAAQLRSVVLGGVAGLAAVGHVRGAELLMGPFLVVLFGVSQVLVPEAGRVFRRLPARLMPFCLALGGGQALAALVWGLGVALVLPLGLGHVLLKELWMPASALLLPVALNVAVAGFVTAALAGVRAMGVAWRSLQAQLVTSAANLVGGAAGAVLGGAAGACWGVMTANTIGAFVWWYHLRSALADHGRQPSGIGCVSGSDTRTVHR